VRVVGASGQIYSSKCWSIESLATGSREIGCVALERNACKETLFFLDLILTGEHGSALSTNRYLLSWAGNLLPLRRAAPAQVRTSLRRNGRRWSIRVENVSEFTAFYLWLEDDRPVGSPGTVSLNHNYFCILPGEQRNIKALWEDVVPAERVIRLAGWNTNVVHLQ
jgi:hypothetical protein